MAEKDDKAAGKAPQKPAGKPGPEAADVAFDDIIDAILSADPESISEHKAKRRKRKVVK